MKLYFVFALVLAATFLSGCDDKIRIDESGISIVSSGDKTPATPVVTTPASSDNTYVEPAVRIALYWENTTEKHDERKPWSDTLTAEIKKDLPAYGLSADIKELCPKYASLSEPLKIKAIGEFWVALFYYESGFNPKSESVDVGTKNDKGSWSVGLGQMSANDSAAKELGVTYEGLKDPLKNIKVCTNQMRKQLKNTGTIMLDNSSKYRYWAVALKGNKYSKVPEIKARVLKYAPSCK